MATERGGTVQHLHVQAVVRARVGSAGVFTKEITRVLGWNTAEMSKKRSILCRVLGGEDMHTWAGMIGYVTKSAGTPDYQVFHQQVTAAEMDLGRQVYAQLGGLNRNVVMLNPSNLLERVYHYRQTELSGRIGVTFMATVVRML